MFSHTCLGAVVAAASLAASLPGLAAAQTGPLQLPNARPPALGANEQLDALNARIDRELAAGRLSPADATEAHRQVNRIEDETSADREAHGGRLTDTDRFALQGEIDHLRDELHNGHVAGPAN